MESLVVNIRSEDDGSIDRDALKAEVGQILNDLKSPRDVPESESQVVAQSVTDEDFVSLADGLLYDVLASRHRMGFSPYREYDKRCFVGELGRTKIMHRDHNRDSGEPYFDTHLLGVMNNVRNLTGLTGAADYIAAMHHDDTEDLYSVKINPDLLFVPGDYGLVYDQNPNLGVWICKTRERVKDTVRAVSKIKIKDRELSDADAFLHLLKMIGVYGPRVGCIKLSDRLHNLGTLDSHEDKDRAKDIARRSSQVYIPLARVLKLHEIGRAIADKCAQILNPELYKDFEALLEQRVSMARDVFQDSICAKFTGRGENSDNPVSAFAKENIHRLVFKPAGIYEFVHGRELESARLSDLNINPTDPLFSIDVVTRSDVPSIERPIMHYLVSLLSEGYDYAIWSKVVSSKRTEADGVLVEHVPQRQNKLEIDAQEPFGTFTIRIKDAVSANREKRGWLADGADEVPEELIAVINDVVRETGKEVKRVFQVAEERLKPNVVCYTPHGERIELRRGATVLDYAQKIHRDFLVGLQSAQLTWHTRDIERLRGRQVRDIGIFDEVQDGMVITLGSCLDRTRETPSDWSKIKIDPGWLLFCRHSGTRDLLKKEYLRLTGTTERGVAYVKKIAALFSTDENAVLSAVRKYKGFDSSKGVNDSQIYYQIGRGSIDIIQILEKEMLNGDSQKNTRWSVRILLPDVPGALHRFIAEFDLRGINIYKLGEHVKGGKGGVEGGQKLDEVQFEVEYSESEKPHYEVMKTFLKLSYEYDLNVQIGGEKRGFFSRLLKGSS